MFASAFSGMPPREMWAMNSSRLVVIRSDAPVWIVAGPGAGEPPSDARRAAASNMLLARTVLDGDRWPRPQYRTAMANGMPPISTNTTPQISHPHTRPPCPFGGRSPNARKL